MTIGKCTFMQKRNHDDWTIGRVSKSQNKVIKPMHHWFRVLANRRSLLRKKACTFVTQRYKGDPKNRCECNIEIAKNLLGNGGLFLKDGSDAEVRRSDSVHAG